MSEEYKCKNCGSSFTGEYCKSCGQKKIDVVSIKTIFSKVFELFELESGFFLTFKTILLTPNKFFSNYLNGKTKVYTNPILFMITIMAFISITLSIHIKFNLGGNEFGNELIYYLYFIPYIFALSIIFKVFYFNYFKYNSHYLIVSIYLISIKMFFFILFVYAFFLDNYFDSSLFEYISNIIQSVSIFYFTFFIFSKGNIIIRIFKSILVGFIFKYSFDNITLLLDNSNFMEYFNF